MSNLAKKQTQEAVKPSNLEHTDVLQKLYIATGELLLGTLDSKTLNETLCDLLKQFVGIKVAVFTQLENEPHHSSKTTTKPIFVCPLSIYNQIVGELQVYELLPHKKELDDNDQAFLRAFSEQASIAIQALQMTEAIKAINDTLVVENKKMVQEHAALMNQLSPFKKRKSKKETQSSLRFKGGPSELKNAYKFILSGSDSIDQKERVLIIQKIATLCIDKQISPKDLMAFHVSCLEDVTQEISEFEINRVIHSARVVILHIVMLMVDAYQRSGDAS
jgi:hypothetical protein